MMCLGKNWDPEGRKYEERRSMDNVKPPDIPETFKKLVERAIQDAHAFIKKHSNVSSVEAVLPNMTPDVCIVNFYTDTGKLGLHQVRQQIMIFVFFKGFFLFLKWIFLKFLILNT